MYTHQKLTLKCRKNLCYFVTDLGPFFEYVCLIINYLQIELLYYIYPAYANDRLKIATSEIAEIAARRRAR